ncbi:MAG: NnrS family protein, partial [Deltaproteobacteria bacterium]|nr:NnrS family protein [Deltaproteobacteria bacterium]
AGLWIAGRITVFLAASLPTPWIAAAIDVSYGVALAGVIAAPIFASGKRRNYVFPVLLGVFALANGLCHIGALGIWPEAAGLGTRLGVGVLVVLVSTLGGRLVPLFTSSALARSEREGDGEEGPDELMNVVSRVVWADQAAGPAVVVALLADALWPGSIASGALAGVAGLIVAIRSSGWGLRWSVGDPLLWSMHVAYLWIPIGLLGLAASAFGLGLPRAFAVHALTVGAIAGMILAIMTRVVLGHTGRPMRAPRAIWIAYGLLHTSALMRSALVAVVPSWAGGLLLLSGGLFAIAFGIFLTIYAPMLVAPRVDGKPG